MFSLISTAFAILLVTVGPWEVAPVFLAITQGQSAAERRGIAIVASIVGASILVAFAIFGTTVFGLLGISLPAFRTAGGFLLLKLSADLLLAHHSELTTITVSEEREAQSQKRSVAVFPLGIPMIAGPGAMTGVVLLVSKTHGPVEIVIVIGVIAFVCGLTFGSMLAAERINRLIGVTGSNVIARVSGILLAALAMQFVFDGLSQSGIFH